MMFPQDSTFLGVLFDFPFLLITKRNVQIENYFLFTLENCVRKQKCPVF